MVVQALRPRPALLIRYLRKSRFYPFLQLLQEEEVVLLPRMGPVELPMPIPSAEVGHRVVAAQCTDVSIKQAIQYCDVVDEM